MSLIRTLWKCAFSPRLFKIYEKSYEAKNLERWGDHIVISFAAIWSMSLYAVPVIAMFAMYQRGYSLTDNVSCLSKLAAGAGALLVASLAARGYSRVNNPVYVKFVETLNETQLHYNASTKQELNKYDFEFWAWPVDFDVSELSSNTADKLTLEKIAKASGRLRRQSGKEFLFAIPCKLLSYAIAHTFAGKLIYPGSISFIGWVLGNALQLLLYLRFHGFRVLIILYRNVKGSTLVKGRVDLMKLGGERFKLMTADKNQIDAMFVDRRNKSAYGDVLVVTCEGNCGFYETGIISTPLTKGYSVLGWNHPGFASSTGAPYPEQEENAIDCIMRFAIERLKFPEERIIVYGWSIGGYPATWAAMNYPSIRSLVLDATFDDVLPLAIKTMPPSLEGLVRNIIRDYFNLNIAEQLNRYNGTVLLVRRTDDEILSIPPNSLSGNRGNMLLMKLLLRRYPHLFSETSESGTVLSRFLSAEASDRTTILASFQVEEKRCLELIAANIRSDDGVINYPSTLGQNCNTRTKLQLVLFLATMYMKDQSSSHCIPLSVDLFHPGWDPASAIAVK